MPDLYYAYHFDIECHQCAFGETVMTNDWDIWVICFVPWDKRTEDKCSNYTLPESLLPEGEFKNDG